MPALASLSAAPGTFEGGGGEGSTGTTGGWSDFPETPSNNNIVPFVAPEAKTEAKAAAAPPQPVQNVLPTPQPLPAELNQTYNEAGLGLKTEQPEFKPVDTPTPTQESLQRIATNPLNIPDNVNKALIERTSNVPPSALPPSPIDPVEPGAFVAPELQAQKAAASTAPAPFIAPELKAAQATFIAPEVQPQQQKGAAGPDADIGPEQIDRNYAQYLDTLIKPYNDDPQAAGVGFHADKSIPFDDTMNAILYAQKKYDNKEPGMALSPFGDFLKTGEDVQNATNWLGRTIADGWNGLVVQPLQIPGQVGGSIGNAIDIANPSQEGTTPLQPPKNAPSNWVNPAGIGGRENNVNIVTGGEGTGGGGAFPGFKENTTLESAMDQRRQASERALVAGVEEGTAQHTEWVENSISHLIGLTSTVPNAALKLFGGPQIGYIDPKIQTLLTANPGNPIPILSDKSYMDMDPREVAAQLLAGRTQDSLHAQRGAGYLGGGSEQFLNTWAGKTVNTPEEAAANGYPVPIKAIQDTAATANLAEGAFSLGLVGRMADAAGINSVLGTSVQKTLEGGADVLQNIADEYAKPTAVTQGTGAVGNAVKNLIKKGSGALVGHVIGPMIGIPPGTAELIGSMVTSPIAKAAAESVKSPGWIPKTISYLADNTADALRLAANDPDNLLATRGTAKQLLTTGIKRAAEGTIGMAPALLGAKTPEDIGSLLGLGVGASIIGHALPDLKNLAQNRLIDSAFITDNNRFNNRQPADPPTPYGTSKALDDAHAAAVDSTYPGTNKPILSNSQKHVMNDLRTALDGVAEGYVLNPKAYQAEVQRMRANGYVNGPEMNSFGVAIDPNPGQNQARILIRSTDFDAAVHHEFSHAITNRMSPEDLQTTFQAYARTNDPNDFTRDYTSRASNGAISATYDQLPTQAGADSGKQKYVAGLEGMTKEDMQKEMATEAISGLLKGGSVKDLTRDPSMLHNMQQTFWRALDAIGLDPVTTRTISPLGLKQSIPAALTLEPLVRDTLRKNLGVYGGEAPELEKAAPAGAKKTTGTPPGTAGNGGTTGNGTPVSGTPDESVIKGLMKRGFNRQQATEFIQKGAVATALRTGPQPAPQQPPATSAPSQPSTASQALPQAPTAPSGQPAVPTAPEPQQPTEAPELSTETIALQSHLRRVEGLSPGESQALATGRAPRATLSLKTPVVRSGKLASLQPDFADRVSAWMDDLRAHGLNPQIVSGGRSRAEQAALYQKHLQGGPLAAPPGVSYHEFGRAVDWANVGPDGKLQYENHEAYKLGLELAKKYDLRGIGPQDEDHIQDARYASYKDLPKGEYGRGVAQSLTMKPEDLAPRLGGVLKGHEQAFLDAGAKYGVDPRLLAAVSIYETGYGNSRAAREFNNVGGMFDHTKPVADRVFQKFGSIDEGIDAMARNLRENYLDKGLESIEEIGKKYAPPGENDIHGENKDWPLSVSQIYGSLGGKGMLGVPKESPGEAIVSKSIGAPTQGTAPQAAPLAPKTEAQASTEPVKVGETPTETATPQDVAEPPAEPVQRPPAPTDADIAAAEQEARNSTPQGKKSDADYANLIVQKVIQSVGEQHADSLPLGDQRVRWNPDTGFVSGKYFDYSDSLHQFLLRDATNHELDIIRQVEEAIRNRTELNPTYYSAPQKEFGLPTAAARKEAQDISTAPARAAGEAPAQEAGKHFIPGYVAVGKDGQLFYGGISGDKLAGNASKLIDRLGPDSPYPMGPHGSAIANEDWRGYVSNLANGYKGTGEAPLNPVEGVNLPKPEPGFVPYSLSKPKADFWNLATGNLGATGKLVKEGKPTSSARARELALANQGYVSGISEPPPEVTRAIAGQRSQQIAEAEYRHEAELETQEHKFSLLQDVQRHGGLPTLKRNNELGKISKGVSYPAGEVRDVIDAWKSLSKDDKQFLAKNYGVEAEKLFRSDADHPDKLNARVAQTSETPFENSADLLVAVSDALSAVKNRTATEIESHPTEVPEGLTNPLHAKIEIETPGFSKQNLHSAWEILRADLTKDLQGGAPAIHPGHPEITKGLQEKGYLPSAPIKAGFLPGDIIENPKGEREQISAAALMYTNPDTGKRQIFTGPTHMQAMLKGQEKVGDFDKVHDNSEQGFLTDSGRFVSRKEAWTLAKAAKQVPDEEGRSAADSSDLRMSYQGTPHPRVGFMPGDVVELPDGNIERIKSPAVKINGKLYEQWSHGNAVLKWEKDTGLRMMGRGQDNEGNPVKYEDGFTTDSGRFISRDEAREIALKSRQLKEGQVGPLHTFDYAHFMPGKPRKPKYWQHDRELTGLKDDNFRLVGETIEPEKKKDEEPPKEDDRQLTMFMPGHIDSADFARRYGIKVSNQPSVHHLKLVFGPKHEDKSSH